MMISTPTLIIGALVVMWLLQLGLSYWQMKRFYRRIAQLRKMGKHVSVGMDGSAWKGRQYGVLVVDEEDRIVHAEQLSGWTVLSGLKPVSGMEGRMMVELFDDNATWPVPNKLRLAFRNAAQHIRDARERAAKRQLAESETLGNTSPASGAA